MRFGVDQFEFELDTYFWHALSALERIPTLQPALTITAPQFESLVDWVYDDADDGVTIPCAGFADVQDAKDLIEQMIWRDYYAADRSLIGIANGSSKQVVHAVDSRNRRYATALVERHSFELQVKWLAQEYATFAAEI